MLGHLCTILMKGHLKWLVDMWYVHYNHMNDTIILKHNQYLGLIF